MDAYIREIEETLRHTYLPEGVRIWLTSRNRNLDGGRPLDMIRDGQHSAVLAEARRVAES